MGELLQPNQQSRPIPLKFYTGVLLVIWTLVVIGIVSHSISDIKSTGYGLIWLLGMMGIVLGSCRLGWGIRRREQVERAWRQARDELEIRTRDLAKTIETLQIEIDQRQQVEEKLRRGERFLADIFDSIKDGISILDENYYIVRVNAAMERAHPQAMPLVGKKCYEAYHGRAKPCEICPARQTLETGQVGQEVVIEKGADGEILRYIDLLAFPLIDMPTGQRKGVVEYVRDITQQKPSRRRCVATKSNCAILKRWRPSAAWPAGWPMTSIIS